MIWDHKQRIPGTKEFQGHDTDFEFSGFYVLVRIPVNPKKCGGDIDDDGDTDGVDLAVYLLNTDQLDLFVFTKCFGSHDCSF